MDGPHREPDSNVLTILQRLINGDEAVVRVDERGVHHAAGAIIPIGAIQALMAYAGNVLVTAVADGMVRLATAGCEAASHLRLQPSALNSRHKGVPGMVTVTVFGEAGPAEVVVLARRAVNKFYFGELLYTAVACADARVQEVVEDRDDPLGGKGCRGRDRCRFRCRSRCLDRLRLLFLLRSEALRGAVDDATIHDVSLDKPVVGTFACDTPVDAPLAKIKVAVVAGRAVIMGPWDGPVTAIAANGVVTPKNRAARDSRRRCGLL
jgi:hypothetical protein